MFEARAAGADAVLLIAECLDDDALGRLYRTISRRGMTPLVELYQPENLPRVLRLGARLIGINNRDLRTFRVDLEQTLRLRGEIPAGPDRGQRERHPHPGRRRPAVSGRCARDARRREPDGPVRHRRSG